ncbi:MAG: hypothetical protein IPI97_14500 [Nitrosomonas sp.]|nr:hypothetical protein [Nitrosomonas sp.]
MKYLLTATLAALLACLLTMLAIDEIDVTCIAGRDGCQCHEVGMRPIDDRHGMLFFDCELKRE